MCVCVCVCVCVCAFASRGGGGEGGQARYFDRFYMALFSALEQTHCILVACRISLGDRSPLYIYIIVINRNSGHTALFVLCMADATRIC